MHFLGRKTYFSSPNFFSLKKWNINIYEYLKTFHEEQKFISEKPRTLGAWNRQFSPKGGGIFYGEPYISIYFTDIKSFFNLDNLEPAPGRPDPELKVKTLKTGKLDKQAPGCRN